MMKEKKILKIMLEKNEDISETIDEKTIKNEFFEVLTNINQDFKKAYSMLDNSEKTKLIFCDYNTITLLKMILESKRNI